MASSYYEETPGSRFGKWSRKSYDLNGVLLSNPVTDRTYSWVDFATKGLNPNWRSQITRNQNATTVLDGEHYEVGPYQPGYIEATATSGGVRRYTEEGMLSTSHITVPASPTTIDVSASDNEAKSYFLRELIAANTSMRGMVALGELGQTLRMLRNPAKLLRSGLDDYFNSVKRRSRGLSRPKIRDMAAASWLEHSFGWRPLINDINDAGDALNKRNDWDNARVLLKGYGRSASSSTSTSSTSQGLITSTTRKYDISTAETIYRGASRSVPMNPLQWQALQFGFRPEEFVPTIWELIPYSFLVDYFVNIGDIIEGWSWQRSGLAWAARTYRKTRTIVATTEKVVAQNPSTTTVKQFSPATSVVSRRQVNRIPYSGNFIPNVVFQIPGFGDTRKWINIAALATLRWP